jgi:hypothetical protein
MKLSLRSLSLATVAAAALAVAPAAYADILYPIGSTAPTVGPVLSTFTSPTPVAATPNTYTVSYTAQAYQDAVTHDMDFLYHIDSVTSTGDAVTTLSLAPYAFGNLVAVEAVGPGQAPNSPADLNTTNQVLSISFATNPIGNGESSQTIWLLTNVPLNQYTFGSFSSTSAADSVAQLNPSFAPFPTPEPSTFALMGTGLLAAAGAVRRRVKA